MYTQEQKKQYFKSLRDRWQSAKELAESDKIKGIIAELQRTGLNASARGIAFIWAQMESQKLEGLPVIDAKTFHGWKDAGFIVKKGEKSTLEGITWITAETKAEGDQEETYKLPKAYHLFHRSQVQPL